ncbi:IgGFc-binding protein-like [Aulostomus maculatus]
METARVCMHVNTGLCEANPGRRFLMMFPPHNDPSANASRRVTITATNMTSVSVKVLETDFMQQIFIPTDHSKTINLPSSVEMASGQSSRLLSVTSAWPVTVLASFCTQTGCEHSLLHDVTTWGTHYYPVSPNFPRQTAVSQMVVTSSDHETSVDIFLSGEVVFKGDTYPMGSILTLHLGVLQSVFLQSNYSLSGSELNSQEAVGVVVGFTCSQNTTGNCLYGFTQLNPVSHWSFDYIIPPSVNTGMSPSFLLAIATISSDLDVNSSTARKNVSLVGGVMKVIPVVVSDKIHITSDSPLQLIYFRYDNEQHSSTLTALLSVDDICQSGPKFDSATLRENQVSNFKTGDFESGDHISLPDDSTETNSSYTDEGYYVSIMKSRLYPSVCEEDTASCEELRCSHKQTCSIKDAKPFCSPKTKICSAWGDSYYRTFDGRDFALLGNCNYTFVQTTCPGSNVTVRFQINIARAYLNSATASTIHTVEINIQGFNISMVKAERNHVRINQKKRNLPYTFGRGSLKLYQSGATVVLDTVFGLALQYDWVHHLQVEVGPELYGGLCGLCGNANRSFSDGIHGLAETQAVDFTLPWVLSRHTGFCNEECAGVSCPVCTQSQTKMYPGSKGDLSGDICNLLKKSNGPFADCHPFINPEPFVRSCMNNLCISRAASSMCKPLMAYANICQRLGARIYNWRTIANCSMTCPINSHYEICGSACPVTCGNLEAKHNCSLPCVESCQCNKGYLLSGGKCVVPSKCGCVLNGSYYLPKENFWTDHCQEKCVCQPSSKKVMCIQSHCQDGEVCGVSNGVMNCHKDGPGICVAKGDPHYTTFDGRNFDVHGNCSYLLTSHCPSWGDLNDFSVEVQHQMKEATNVSLQRVKMVVSGYSIEMSHELGSRVMVNGLLLNLPSVLSQGKVKLYMTGCFKCIETGFGVVVTYSSDILTVQMPRIYSGNLCGLCGNFNANPEDDLMLEENSDLPQVVKQWQTSSEDECVDVTMDTSGCSHQQLTLYQEKDFCGKLLDTEGVFQSCHKTVEPQDFYNNCVYDLCSGNHTTLCQILSSYVAVCQEMGAIVDEWRHSNFCSLSCPSNSEYHLCSRHRFDCVENPSPLSQRCREGCFCKPGFFHSGGDCIPNSECGCSYDGVYHEIHENFHPDEKCRLHCICKGHNQIDGVLRGLPVQLDHVAVLYSGSLTRVVTDYGVITYGGPDLIHIVIPAQLVVPSSRRKMCGLCGNVTAIATDDRQSLNGSLSKDAIFASSWSLSPPATNCSEDCEHCPVCNSTMAAEFASDSLCGILLAVAGPFSICHATVDPQPFFQNCVNDLCRSYNEELFCSILRQYTFACQEAGAEVKPWRGGRCALSCPEYSHYNVCISACSESCAILSDIPCPWPCHEGCQCDSGYMQSGNGCVTAERCGCFFRGHYYEVGEISWAEGCSEMCNCTANATMCCEPASCPEGESCTLNDTWGCTGKAVSCPLNSHYETCGTACPATCEAPVSSRPCTLACVAGCQCDPSFVLHGDNCVSLSQCGCTYNGHHYHSNQTFWADESCTEQCVCDLYTNQTVCHLASCGPDEYCSLQDGVRSCVLHPKQMCTYSGHHIFTFDQRDYDLHGTCQYQLLGMCEQRQGFDVIEVHVQTDGHLESALYVLVRMSGALVELNSKHMEDIQVDGVKKNLPYHLNPNALALSLGLHLYIYTDVGFVLSLSIEGIVSIHLSTKYANATCGLCGNFNSDPADDLTVNGTELLSTEHFGKAWRSGQNPWCVEGCLGGSCPKCSSDHLARYSDSEACGKMLEANGPFRLCHNKVEPTSFYKHCISDLCLYGDLQPAICRSLAEYTAACLSHNATVYAWRSPAFCHEPCPSSPSYNSSSVPVHFCLGWKSNTVQMPLNIGENCLCEAGLVHSGSTCVNPENCGCFYHKEYLRAGQEVSTCEQSCLCHSGGHMTCHNISCGENKECKRIGGVQGCHPKAKVAHCSVDGTQFNTFDGQAFEFHGSCNYTLVQTCSLKMDVDPVLITAQGNHSEGRQIHLHVSNMSLKMSRDFPGKVQVNGVLENLPFSLNNVSVSQTFDWRSIKTPQVEIISDLRNHIKINIPDNYHQTTCGLCGNYNDEPSDDMQLPNSTIVSDPDILVPSWKLPNNSSCSDTCDGTCQLCQSAVPEFTANLYCGLLTHPGGPFSSCGSLVFPQKYYSLCMKNLCIAEGQKWSLCDSLQAYQAACKEAGVKVDHWRNTTGCTRCPQFSHFSQCANICSSLCPEIGQAVQCPKDCEEGCQCDPQHLYDGHACVPEKQCGCVKDGRRFKVSESKLLQNCTVNCTCGPPLVCEPYSCPLLHSCVVSDGIVGCRKEQTLDPCQGACDESEKCYLSNGVPVCEGRRGRCWTWGSQHYHTFDGLYYNFDGTCTYLLAGSRGAACGLTPFSVSKKNDCTQASQVVTVNVYGFIIKLGAKGSVHVNGQVNYIPINLLRSKIQISDKEGKALLKTDFGMQVIFDWNTTVLVILQPHYKGKVYGLCGNFNGNSQDEYAVNAPGFLVHPVKTSLELALAYRLFDGDWTCCSGCKQKSDEMTLNDTFFSSSHIGQCAVIIDPNGPYSSCHSRVNPDSFYQSCIVDLMHGRGSVAALKQACVQGCFCKPGFLRSPEGCVFPQQCGCTDSGGKYHSLNTTFWTPEDCGQTCVCGPATGEVTCSPSQCPRGMVCKKRHHKRMCETESPMNCTVVTGLHFTTFDGHHFDFRDSCAYSLVQTNYNVTSLTPFNITFSDASCHKRFFHSFTLTLSVYGLEVTLTKTDPGRVVVNGLHKPLPFSHDKGHVTAYQTPSSLVIQADMGLQLLIYKTGTMMVILPSSYRSSVSGLCGNANTDRHDDQRMPNEQEAQNTLEFAHSWRLGGSQACRSSCTPRMKHCPAEAQKLFEGSDFCEVLLNELGPFADCASGLSPKQYFRSCVADTCFYGGHYSALCSAITAYAAACQAAQLPVRRWRSDTFCNMLCPKNSHYELCGPRCPVTCDGLSSPANCSGGCEEGCQCDPGYILSDGQCVLISDCGCMHEGQYYPAGVYYSGKSCQKCICNKGKLTCSPSPCRPTATYPLNNALVQYRPLNFGACEVIAGFSYITFDGLVLPHHGAHTYIVSSVMDCYSVLVTFKEDRNGSIFTIDKLQLLTSMPVEVNGEHHTLPFGSGKIKAFQDGDRLTVTTEEGLKLELFTTLYMRITIPQEYDTLASGLCGNFNGDKSDELELRNGHLAKSITEFLHSWAATPGQRVSETCGSKCDQCSLSPQATVACDILVAPSIEFSSCWNNGVEPHIYKDVCIRAVCAGAGHIEAVCLALEAYAATCQAKGVTVGSWRVNTPCSLQCPDRSSPSQCVGSGSNVCPALLQPGSPAAGCSSGCQCLNENVFDGGECVPYSQCGCVLQGRYIKMDEELYSEDCSERCWCHPLGGALCETTACSPEQWCVLRNGSWGCHDRQEVCELKDSLQVSTLSRQQLKLEPKLSYSLMSLCDEASEKWFSLISYYGPCDKNTTRLATVFHILLQGSSVSIQDGIVMVDGLFVSLPHSLPSGVSLSSGVTQDKLEVTVIVRRDEGMESEFEMEIGVTMVTIKVTPWYAGKLCGLCGNIHEPHSHGSVKSWVLPDCLGCGPH